MRRYCSPVLIWILAVGGVVLVAAPASAAQTGWSTFTFGGTSQAFSGTMTLAPTGFPSATFVSTSAAGGVGIQSGATTFLPPQTPPARTYGSSRGAAYLNLRAEGRTAQQSSVTTYTFERPTPSAGWTFVLGDIDADEVAITATDADGVSVSPADLGFRSSFNYCAAGVSPKPACTPPNNDGSFRPTWNAATGVLEGDAQGRDTAGASAWFEPRVGLSSLTFTYALRQGSPVYQTWFSALAFDLTGAVTAPAGQADDIELRLLDPAGNQVATTRTGTDGSYSFPGLASYVGYRLALVRPPGLVPVDGQPLSRVVDLSNGDQVEDFALRALVPSAASGTVNDRGGAPLAGVVVTLTGNGITRTTITDGDGGYVFDSVPVGTGYTVTASAPADTTISAPRTFNVSSTSDDPITDLDFTVTDEPRGSLRGTVTRIDTGGPAPEELITVTGPGGSRQIRTDAEGRWSVEGLEPGDYTVTVTASSGDTVVGARTRQATITAAGNDVGGLDFRLTTPEVQRQSASGRVTLADGTAVAGARVTAVDPFDGQKFSAVTGADGRWRIDGLYPDEGWQATITPPKGYRGVGATTRTFSLLDDATDIDFVLAPIPRATPTPSASPTSTPSATAVAVADGDGTLADTGGPALQLTALAVVLLLLSTLVASAAGRRG